MILTAGLTPAWQQILVFDGFRYGTVNRAAEAYWCASGKVFNAGIAAHRLGVPSLTLAPVGGAVTTLIDHDVHALGLPHRWIATHAATRVCTTILDRTTGTMTELVENGRPLLPEDIEHFRRAYAEEVSLAEVAVITGSLPVDTPDSLYVDLLRATRCPTILDFRGPGLLAALEHHPYVVKPNREELEHTVGRPLATDKDLLAAMRELNQRGAQWVIITQGSKPVWITSRDKTYHLQPLRVEKIVNPIGCGDALTAALAWGTRQGLELVEAARLGVAAAALNLAQLFPCRYDPAPIRELAEQVQVERG